ncbi:MAG: hypothetical protein EBR82_49100 [Caulobacteraceae bacterium]|nr:hypothetical protein [Caulobacteraceae bacterium]
MKSMAGMKLSPEDAMSWMYYATHEHTPWNAHAANGVVATGEKRNQKGDYIAAMEKARQRRLDIKDVDWDALTAGKPLTIDDIFGNTAAMSRMHFEKPKLIEHGDIELLGVEPRAGLVSREGAFGRAITTGSKNEGTILIDKALWNEAVRGDKASRELFLKVLKHEMGHVDDGANVYDRSPTEQERVADEFEARYQPRALLAGELDKLASKGTPHALAADAYKAGYNTRDAYLGSLRERFNEVNKLSPEDRLKLDAHMQKENDSKILQTPEPEIADAYKQLRGTFYPSVPADYNREGFMIRTAAGGARARGTDPTYSAEHTISDDVKRIFRTPEGEPKRQALYDDFINHYSKLYAADNPSKTAAEVLAYAEGKYQEEMKIMRGESDAGDAHFAGAIKPQGYSLPPSWRSNDLLAKLDNYARRTATDFAYQKHIESNPNLMASLGSKSYKNGIAIPDAILRANQHQQIILDPSMQSVIREFNGQPARPNDSAMAGATRLVGVGAIGPISKPKDVVATTFKGLSYLQPTDYAAGVADFVGRLANWGELRQRSYESGLNRRDAAAQMKTVLGSADELSNWMTKSAEKISKYTGLNQLESAARTIAQGWGETIVGLTKTRALSGDVKSAEFLDKLSKDWRSRTDADLAAQVGRLLQGTYDMRTLPAWALEGPAAPFLTWSKWSIGQYNNFKKFAIEPAMKGDVAPLIGQMVIGVAGGSAVQAVADWMNNRENKDINWSELSSWVDQNQGQLGKDGVELLGQKLLTLAQNLGTFGFAGDLAKTLVDSVSGGGQGVGTMPVYDAAIDTGKRTMAALKAIDNGEDFGRVLRQLVVDLGKGHFQVARAASNWIDTDSNLEYNDKRRRRLYDELSGTPQAGNAFAVSYDNLTERDLDRAEPEQVGDIASRLIERAATESRSLEEFQQKIRKYKTSQNGVMPNPERDPAKAMGYLSWLEDSSPGAGVDANVRYESNKRMAAFRKAAIAQGSGVY